MPKPKKSTLALVDDILRSGRADRAFKKYMRDAERVLKELREARQIDPATLHEPCDAPLRWKRMQEAERMKSLLR
jgi:hypothetical protein